MLVWDAKPIEDLFFAAAKGIKNKTFCILFFIPHGISKKTVVSRKPEIFFNLI